jgi:hypothetical protein
MYMKEKHSFLYDKELPGMLKLVLIIKHCLQSTLRLLKPIMRSTYYHSCHFSFDSNCIFQRFTKATSRVTIQMNY